ncbi:MAG: hypothetical protein ACRDZO_07215 [Egibacteraceae bacterium]
MGLVVAIPGRGPDLAGRLPPDAGDPLRAPRVAPPGTASLFRRGASTLLAAQGVDAKTRAAIIGHRKVATTDDVYTDVLDPQLRAAAEALGQVLDGGYATRSPITRSAMLS